MYRAEATEANDSLVVCLDRERMDVSEINVGRL